MKKALSFFTALAFLAACTGIDRGTALRCPETGILSGAEVDMPDPGNVNNYGKIENFYGACARNKKGDVVFELALDFSARQEPRTTPEMTLQYFVALLSSAEDVLQRQGFSTTVDFDNEGFGVSREEHVITIPVPPEADVGSYKVVIGLAQDSVEEKKN